VEGAKCVMRGCAEIGVLQWDRELEVGWGGGGVDDLYLLKWGGEILRMRWGSGVLTIALVGGSKVGFLE